MIYHKTKNSFKIKLNGDFWTVSLYSEAVFFEKHRTKNWRAVTWYNHKANLREIDFCSKNLSKVTITHELVHALMSRTGPSKKTIHTFEEEACDIIGLNLKSLHKLTDEIYKEFMING